MLVSNDETVDGRQEPRPERTSSESKKNVPQSEEHLKIAILMRNSLRSSPPLAKTYYFSNKITVIIKALFVLLFATTTYMYIVH